MAVTLNQIRNGVIFSPILVTPMSFFAFRYIPYPLVGH